MRRPHHLPLAVVAVLGCSPALPSGGATGAPSAAREVTGSDVEVELAPGGAVRLPTHGVSVAFDSVSADSRCPRDVTCVWAGDGAVHIRVFRPERTTRLTLHTTLEPRSARAEGVAVELQRLDPAPTSEGPIDPARYRLRLRIHGG